MLLSFKTYNLNQLLYPYLPCCETTYVFLSNIFYSICYQFLLKLPDNNVTIASMSLPESTIATRSMEGVVVTGDKDNRFSIVKGICGVEGTVSLESVTMPGYFLMQTYSRGILALFLVDYSKIGQKMEACFYPRYDKYFSVS